MLDSSAMARVSAVIPVYNGAATIGRAVASVLAQRYDGAVETIVVDDGSTDATRAILASFGDHIRTIHQPNRGPAAARNVGARLAAGEYLAFLDADDEWMPEKLARTVPTLAARPEVVLVFCDAIPIDAAGNPAADSFVTPDCARAPSMADMLARWWPIIPSAAVMRREAFLATGGFVEEFRSAAYEDPFLFIMMRERGEFAYVPERLVRYRWESPGARIEKYLPYQEVFIRRLRERYGAAARGLIRGTRRAAASAWGYEGLLALRSGDRRAARDYFLRALRARPADLKTILRLARTFLPTALARAMGGRTARNATARTPNNSASGPRAQP